MGSVETLGTSDEMDKDGERVGGRESPGGEEDDVLGGSAKSLEVTRLVADAARAPAGSDADGPSANLRVELKEDVRSRSDCGN